MTTAGDKPPPYDSDTMDFDLTKEQSHLQTEAREFAEREFTREYAIACDRDHRYPAEAHRKAGTFAAIAV